MQAALIVLAATAVAIAVIAVIIGIEAFVLMAFWNLVIPSVFGGPALDFGAAFAFVVVVTILGRLFFGVRAKS